MLRDAFCACLLAASLLPTSSHAAEVAAVRPGDEIRMAGVCTAGFAYLDGGGDRWVTTAGHCAGIGALSDEQIWTAGRGPVARVGGLRVGEARYAVADALGDLALVRVDPGVEVVSAVRYWGGPTAMAPDFPETEWALHYGHGMGAREADLKARRSAMLSRPTREDLYLVGYAMFGDSGSPVLSETGEALGLIVAGGAGRTGVSLHGSDVDVDFALGNVHVDRMGPMIARSEKALGIRLMLMTAPLADRS